MTRVEPLSSYTTTLAVAPPTDAVGSSIARSLTPVIPLQESLRLAAEPLDPQRKSSASTEKKDATDGQDGVVALGKVGYTLAWLGIYTLHAVCAVYLVAAGLMYIVLPATQVDNMLILCQRTLDPSYFVSIAYVHDAFAAVHCYFAVKPLCWTVGSKIVPKSVRLYLAALRDCVNLVAFVTSTGSSSQRTGSALLKSAHSSTSCLLRRVYRSLLASDGLFGAHKRHFEFIFLLRELVETALQRYQEYRYLKRHS